MNCNTWQKKILLRDAGELSALHNVRLEAHLTGCPACRAFADELTAVQRLSSPTDEQLAVSEFTLQRIVQEARDHVPQQNAPAYSLSPRHIVLYLPALAALALAAIGLNLLFNQPDTPAPQTAQTEPAPPVIQYAWSDGLEDEITQLQASLTDLSETLDNSNGEDDSQNTTINSTYTTEELARQLLAMEES
jgi:hypothetical protein